MTGEVVNLRRARKARARASARAEADARAAFHGEARAPREARRAEAERALRALEGHARDSSDPDPRGDDGDGA